jgi:hypothetical protein
MANKKQTKKAHRKENRAARNVAKSERKVAKAHDHGLGKLVDSIQKRNQKEDVSQAAARIVTEPTDD